MFPKARKFSVTLKGMLRIEATRSVSNSQSHTAKDYAKVSPERFGCNITVFPQQRVREWGTLDDIPDFALSTLAQLNVLLLTPFQKFYGVIIHGPLHKELEYFYWGRRVKLSSGETLQLRYYPRDLLEREQSFVIISIKLMSVEGAANTRTAILFAPKLNIPTPKTNFFMLSVEEFAPRGLHNLCVSLFPEHSPKRGSKNHCRETAHALIDQFGYAGLRSTTLSLTNDRSMRATRNREGVIMSESKPFQHSQALSVACGISQLRIASHLVGRPMPKSFQRPSEPMHTKDWMALLDFATREVCSDDAELGRSAIAASVRITDLLSIEGLLSLSMNKLVKGAMPSSIRSPKELAMVFAMAVRIAMVPANYELSAGSATDQQAAAELRTIFEGALEPCRVMKGRLWCIDVAINMARARIKKCKSAQHANAASMAMIQADELIYWQRAGQHAITSIFGQDNPVNESVVGPFGVAAWRFHDPLLAAKNRWVRATADKSMRTELEWPPMEFATLAKRRKALVKLMLDCEDFLRSGTFDGEQLVPSNADTTLDAETLRSHAEVNNMISPQFMHEFLETRGVVRRKVTKSLYFSYCISAISCAADTMATALQSGPVVHFRDRVGAYLVSDSQTAPCPDCSVPVGVLQGILLNHSHAECAETGAKRCLRCAGERAKEALSGLSNAA